MINQSFFNLRTVWRHLNILKSDQLSVEPDLPESNVEKIRQQVHECLAGKGGDVSARAHAAKLGEAYLGLSDIGRLRFLKILAEDFGVDAKQVQDLATALVSSKSQDEVSKLHQKMRLALRPDSLELLTKFNSLPSGVKFLVDMRADLLRLSDKSNAKLNALDSSLRGLLRSWFDIGFLDLVRMSWGTSAAVLEKLIDYEAVHAIRSWSDLKNRLQSDRRCYAFFHPRMPEEPLIFVQVALVNNLSNNIQVLLDESAPLMNSHTANTAIFYSISNAQAGLAGVGFGDFLIKRVVADLKAELPNITTFSTLSPIPGLCKWLGSVDDAELLESGLITSSELDRMLQLIGATSIAQVFAVPDWHQNDELANALLEPMTRITAHYLLNVKRRNRALDPVANFHLNNGARLERINWLADTSAKGMRESMGLMVNYLYKLDDIESNHERYRHSASVTRSSTIDALLH